MLVMIMAARSITTMTEPDRSAALLRLMTWLSPSFPVGAFSYSHGLEWAVENGAITDRIQLTDWITGLLRNGGGWSDAVLFANAFDAAAEVDVDQVVEIAGIAEALAPSKERHLETMAQGAAFMKASAAWPDSVSDHVLNAVDSVAYPIAVAMKAAAHEITRTDVLLAYLHAFTANLVSAAVRLIPLGQSDGVRAQAQLETVIIAVAEDAGRSGLHGLGSAGLASDIAAMKHETQYTRLFRS